MTQDMPRHIYGYASLRTGHKKNELEANFQKTKLYNDYLDIASVLKSCMLYVPEDEAFPDSRIVSGNMDFDPQKLLQADVMTSARKGMRHKLDCIIKQAKESPCAFDTVIIINSLSSFGDVQSIRDYYREFKDNGIGILFPDPTRESGLSEYSTCGFDFRPREKSGYEMAFRLVEQLEDGDVPDNRGRIGGQYTAAFRTAFWLYELFRISEKTAVAMSGFSKNGFHMKADNYEQTIHYKTELGTLDKEFSISRIIKRNRPVPQDFERLMQSYEETENLELACILCKIPMIFPADYKRLRLKYEGGKKELARCLKLYDNALMDRFDAWTAEGNAATEFYRECGMEKYLHML